MQRWEPACLLGHSSACDRLTLQAGAAHLHMPLGRSLGPAKQLRDDNPGPATGGSVPAALLLQPGQAARQTQLSVPDQSTSAMGSRLLPPKCKFRLHVWQVRCRFAETASICQYCWHPPLRDPRNPTAHGLHSRLPYPCRKHIHLAAQSSTCVQRGAGAKQRWLCGS